MLQQYSNPTTDTCRETGEHGPEYSLGCMGVGPGDYR